MSVSRPGSSYDCIQKPKGYCWRRWSGRYSNEHDIIWHSHKMHYRAVITHVMFAWPTSSSCRGFKVHDVFSSWTEYVMSRHNAHKAWQNKSKRLDKRNLTEPTSGKQYIGCIAFRSRAWLSVEVLQDKYLATGRKWRKKCFVDFTTNPKKLSAK